MVRGGGGLELVASGGGAGLGRETIGGGFSVVERWWRIEQQV